MNEMARLGSGGKTVGGLLGHARKQAGWAYLSPAVFYLALFFLVPLLYALALSLFRWSLLRPDLGVRFVWLSNFRRLLFEPAVWQALGRTLYFVAGSVGIEVVAGLVLALALNRDSFGSRVIISILLIPFMVAPVVVGFTWRFLLNSDFGPLSTLFQSVGLHFLLNPPVLANSDLIMPVLIGVDVWQFTPFVLLVLLAGLRAMSREPFEAAIVDGASAFQGFRYVTLPLLRPTLLVAVVIRTLTALRVFDTVFVMTGGGPGSSSEVVSYYGYRMAFQSYDVGFAAAVGVLTLLLSLLFTQLYVRVIGWGDEG
ncbi:carbohydrate ABC transporter permease [Limnochorda pilosa]|uniref:ABC transporter permease n=1 Tax=Limnochorda pilosa TaxID=1555112 RepID=A0A0K2SGP4_LIMPI|nr:sugar ABC transporter permease [Limnochorda pilosa]BAS26260.1 ABC transporter permease [Limnochorda pilosa]